MQSATLFLVLLLASWSFQDDHFYFHGFITCKLRSDPPWCWNVNAFEHDYIDSNDYLGSSDGCSYDRTIEYKINGSQAGDGPVSFVYDVGFVIIHNCSLVGFRKQQQIWTVEANVNKHYVFEKNFTVFSYN